MTEEDKLKRKEKIRQLLRGIGQGLLSAGLPAIGGAIASRDLRQGAAIAIQVAQAVRIAKKGQDFTEQDLELVAQKVESKDPEIIAAAGKIDAEMAAIYLAQLDAETSADDNATARHAADMAGDGWLSKNVRPVIAAVLIVTQIIITFLLILNRDGEVAASLVTVYTIHSGLSTAVCGFYFGSRRAEKLKRLEISAAQPKTTTTNQS